MLAKKEKRVNVSSQAQGLAGRAVAVGREHNQYYEVWPRIGTIDGPVKYGSDEVDKCYTFLPREMTDVPIPKEGDLQIERLRSAGFEILQVIVGFEPEVEKPEPVDFSKYVEAAQMFGKVVFAIASALAKGLAVLAVGILSIFAMVLDPCLIVVLADGTWLLVWEWLE